MIVFNITPKVFRVCLKPTDNENIVINCLVKDICQPLHGQDILHAKQKFNYLKNLKLTDSNSNDENLCVDILIGSDFLWDIFESEILRGRTGYAYCNENKVWLCFEWTNVKSSKQ